MELCLLGCGGMVPLPDRALSSLLIRQNGKMVLIDCGEGTQVAVKKSGWGFKSIGAILLTHYHADHIAGLPGFLLTLGNSGRTEPVTLFGPPPLAYVIQALTVIAPELPYEVHLMELSDTSPSDFQSDGFYIRSLPVDHFIPCLAYSFMVKRAGVFHPEKAKSLGIPLEFWRQLQQGKTVRDGQHVFTPEMVMGAERKGIKVTYCTDSRPTEKLTELCDASDLLILEGMYGDESLRFKAAERKHMMFSEAAETAKKSRSKELWLTHFSPSVKNPELWMEQTKKIFPNACAGADLIKKEILF